MAGETLACSPGSPCSLLLTEPQDSLLHLAQLYQRVDGTFLGLLELLCRLMLAAASSPLGADISKTPAKRLQVGS